MKRLILLSCLAFGVISCGNQTNHSVGGDSSNAYIDSGNSAVGTKFSNSGATDTSGVSHPSGIGDTSTKINATGKNTGITKHDSSGLKSHSANHKN